MSEPKFTKGPWTVGIKSVSERTFNANTVYDSNGNGICSIFGIPMHCTLEEIIRSGNSSDSEGLAIAHLSAAGPDMYVALGQFIDDEPCEYDHHGNCQTHNLGNPCGVAMAIKALAKARGDRA